MFEPTLLLEKAKHSKRHLALLNFGLLRMIPFNKPHGIKIQEIKDMSVKTLFPYKRMNLNHIKGLHACGLATVSEFTTGVVLLSVLGSKEYRIIMQKMEMQYHYQGKMDAYASFSVTKEWIEQHITSPLKKEESVIVNCEVKTHDSSGNHLTTGNIYWQVKAWNKVKTKA